MVLRLAVVVPVTDSSSAVQELAAEIRSAVPFPIVVVDFSAEGNTQISSVEKIEIWRTPPEEGLRGAFLTAVEELSKQGFTHMIMMEGAYASEIHKLVLKALQHPRSLILGRRKGMQPVFPFADRDWQTRFRLYSLEPLRARKFKNWFFDFDSTLLIFHLLKGIGIEEAEVDAHPPERSPEKLSLTRRAWIVAQRYWRDTILLTLSLLKEHYSPREAAIAMATGAFIGTTPFFGFHTMIILAAAVLFRLNFIFMFIGSHVSTPVLAPFLVASCVYVGKHWLGIGGAGGAMVRVYQWFGGSLVVGTGLGLILGILTYFIVLTIQSSRREPAPPSDDDGGHVLWEEVHP